MLLISLNKDYIDMYFVYGFFKGHLNAVVEEHQQWFPWHRFPIWNVFCTSHQQAHGNGSFTNVSSANVPCDRLKK